MANDEYYLHISIEQPYSSLGSKIFIYNRSAVRIGYMYVYTDTIHISDNKHNIYIKLKDVFEELDGYTTLVDFLDDFAGQIKNRLSIRNDITIDKSSFKYYAVTYYGRVMQRDIDPKYLK